MSKKTFWVMTAITVATFFVGCYLVVNTHFSEKIICPKICDVRQEVLANYSSYNVVEVLDIFKGDLNSLTRRERVHSAFSEILICVFGLFIVMCLLIRFWYIWYANDQKAEAYRKQHGNVFD